MRKNNNKQFFFPPSFLSVKMKDSQRVYRNLRVSSPSCRCANWWHGYSGVTDENALLFMGKRENTSSAAPPPPPAPASGSRAVISPLPVSHWQDPANKIASNVCKDDGAPLLFPPKTRAAAALVSSKSLARCWQRRRGNSWADVQNPSFVRIMSITVLVLLCTFCLEKFLFTSKKCWDVYMTVSPDNHIRGS